MVKITRKESCCKPVKKEKSSFRVESVISVDERGQMVLPKEVREKAQILPGDKLVIVNGEKDGKICCIMLVKVEDLVDVVKEKLSPVLSELF